MLINFSQLSLLFCLSEFNITISQARFCLFSFVSFLHLCIGFCCKGLLYKVCTVLYTLFLLSLFLLQSILNALCNVYLYLVQDSGMETTPIQMVSHTPCSYKYPFTRHLVFQNLRTWSRNKLLLAGLLTHHLQGFI